MRNRLWYLRKLNVISWKISFQYIDTLIRICSPNSPTGNQFEKDDVIQIIEKCNSIVVIDETYVDFAKFSMLDLINKYDKSGPRDTSYPTAVQFTDEFTRDHYQDWARGTNASANPLAQEDKADK